MSESGDEFVISPQRISGRLRWQPVTGDAIVVRSRFDWIALVRLLILAAAALVAYLALDWQTGVYENAAHNAEAILAQQVATRPQPTPDPLPLPTFAPDELVAPTPLPESVATSTPTLPRTQLYHVVQPGETLAEIAVRYSVSPQELLAANPEIADPDLILTGDTIRIFT